MCDRAMLGTANRRRKEHVAQTEGTYLGGEAAMMLTKKLPTQLLHRVSSLGDMKASKATMHVPDTSPKSHTSSPLTGMGTECFSRHLPISSATEAIGKGSEMEQRVSPDNNSLTTHFSSKITLSLPEASAT